MAPGFALPPRVAHAIRLLQADLDAIFGARLTSLVLYGRHVPGAHDGSASDDRERGPIHTLALVDSLAYGDLAACAPRAEAWDGAGLAMPLLLSPAEFASSLDAFPLEYGAIITRHIAVTGNDPFDGISVRAEDRRRACEAQAKSHLIHLREGFLQAEGQGRQLARLIHSSARAFGTLLANVVDLDEAGGGGSHADLARHAARRLGLSDTLLARLLALPDRPPLNGDEAAQLYPPYLDASERVARFVDGWKETGRA